jgi:hypothetical protein
MERRISVCGPSAASIGRPGWRWGTNRSARLRKIPPIARPIAAGNQAGSVPCTLVISIAGTSSDQKLAAIITPAAKPIIPLKSFWFTSRATKQTAAPSGVRVHVKIPARNAWFTGPSDRNHSIILPIPYS